MSEDSETIGELESFIHAAGMEVKSSASSSSFGDTQIVYRGSQIQVNVFSDRSIWFVEVGDLAAREGAAWEWHSMPLIRDLLGGVGPGDLPFCKQAEFLIENWQEINEAFAPERVEETLRQLKSLRFEEQERTSVMRPNRADSEFVSLEQREIDKIDRFLLAKGLAVQVQPGSPLFDDKMMTYKGPIKIQVTKDSQVRDRSTQWFIDVGETSHSARWYDMGLIRDFIGESGHDRLPIKDQTAVLMNNWATILGLFRLERAAETHRQLKELKKLRIDRRFPTRESE